MSAQVPASHRPSYHSACDFSVDPQAQQTSMETVCQEAQRLTHGDRNEDYGHPLSDFSKQARMWSVILGADVTPEQVGMCMIATKLVRHINRPKRDNITDVAGYANTLGMIAEKKGEWA